MMIIGDNDDRISITKDTSSSLVSSVVSIIACCIIKQSKDEVIDVFDVLADSLADSLQRVLL